MVVFGQLRNQFRYGKPSAMEVFCCNSCLGTHAFTKSIMPKIEAHVFLNTGTRLFSIGSIY